MQSFVRGFGVAAWLAASAGLAAAQSEVEEDHEAHGPTFPGGPRARPEAGDELGQIHFPVTSRVREVQQWFDAGHVRLAWDDFVEAERCFRWCLRLDPECAMAWWGLARSFLERGRLEDGRAILGEAFVHDERVTERERLVLAAWREAYFTRPESGLVPALERLILAWPDDAELLALLARAQPAAAGRLARDGLLRAVLAESPNHPGAHRDRVKTWMDFDAAVAWDSVEALEAIAPDHPVSARLRRDAAMAAGHWHDAARAAELAWSAPIDRLLRARDVQAMAHDRDAFNQCLIQLGHRAVLVWADEPFAVPAFDEDGVDQQASAAARMTVASSWLRTQLAFEQWDVILGAKAWWNGVPEAWRAYAEALAMMRTQNESGARERASVLDALDDDAVTHGLALEVRGLLAIADGDVLQGLSTLAEATEADAALRRRDIQSPARLAARVLGEAYLAQKSPELAVQAFERALQVVPGDAASFAGLAIAHQQAGRPYEAEDAWGRSQFIAVEPTLPLCAQAAALGIEAAPWSPDEERPYDSTRLPTRWGVGLPPLLAEEMSGRVVQWDAFQGRPTLAVVYLGEACAHCVEQLQVLGDHALDFELRGVSMVALSGDTPEANRESQAIGPLPFTLLSDDEEHANARRLRCYDDFSESELHGTFVIDARGHVRFVASGAEPYMNVEHLLETFDRILREDEERAARDEAGGGAP